MLALDANLWIAAFDPADRFHDDSVALFRAAAERGLPLAGPAYVVLESVCALARRVGDSAIARAAGEKMAEHPALHLEPLSGALLAEAERLGVDCRLRGADALYAATAARLGCPLLSWDTELITRGGALSPHDWLATNPGARGAASQE
ncbi:MAG TPA: PIN domain-containing protein [Thermoanaerobaculia bacterium]|nr:PIN domain-containing protein [Thermoanaerobaculia bacterium]